MALKDHKIKFTNKGETLLSTPHKEVHMRFTTPLAFAAVCSINKHPVVVKDLRTGNFQLNYLKPNFKSAFSCVVGDVKAVKKLASGDFFVDCVSKQQQDKLLQTKKLAGIDISCRLPRRIRIGIIFKMIDKEQLEQCPRVSKVQHKQLKCNKTATVIHFNTDTLPNCIQLGQTEYRVFPFCGPVRRCTRCQRLNHTKSQCKAKSERCCRCGSTNHSRQQCKETPHCVNCGENHSAAFYGCPLKMQYREAHKMQAMRHMTFHDALSIVKMNSQQTQKKKSYADVVKDGKVSEEDKIDSKINSTVKPKSNSVFCQTEDSIFTTISSTSSKSEISSKGSCTLENDAFSSVKYLHSTRGGGNTCQLEMTFSDFLSRYIVPALMLLQYNNPSPSTMLEEFYNSFCSVVDQFPNAKGPFPELSASQKAECLNTVSLLCHKTA